MSDDINTFLHGYSYDPQTLWIEVKKLSAKRKSDIRGSESNAVDLKAGSYSEVVEGLGSSQGSSFSVIGSDSSVKELKVTLSGRDPNDASWSRADETISTLLKLKDLTERTSWWKRIHKNLSDKTKVNEPTASIRSHYDEVMLDCELPQELMTKLFDDVVSRRVEAVTLQIKWDFALWKGSTLGLFTEDDSYPGSEAWRGHVINIEWVVSEQSL